MLHTLKGVCHFDLVLCGQWENDKVVSASPSWLSPSLSLRQWKIMTDKTLEVRSSVLSCTVAPLYQAWVQAQLRLSSAAALDYSAGLSSTRLCHFFGAISQSHVCHLSEPHPGVASWRNRKMVSGSSRRWSLQG